MNKKLAMKQILYINEEKYYVRNMVEYKEDTWIWQEYEIVATGSNKIRWLDIEDMGNNQEQYTIYDSYRGSINTKALSVEIDGIKYNLEESGTATVKNYFGNADVDKGEKCEYFDYISEDNKHIISVEKWEGETEKSKGEIIEPSKIRFTEEYEKTANYGVNTPLKADNAKGIIGIIITIGLVIIGPIIALFGNIILSGNEMQRFIEKNSNYTYVTSVTNNVNNKKAKVYKAKFKTIGETVKNIIDGVPEKITKVADEDITTEEDGIGLHTNKEYAYIYKENDEIFVQVSSKDFLENDGGSTYHNTRRTHYYRTYRSNLSNPEYSNYATSARQRSVNSRQSSGGGTSSGK